MIHIRTIVQASEEIKKMDPDTAITEYRIRQLVNEGQIPYKQVGNRKLVNMADVLSYFEMKGKDKAG